MSEYLDIITPFLKKSGKIALKNQNLIIGHLKIDGSIVTKTDLNISKNFNKLIKSNFSNHYILDEEKALQDNNIKEKVYNSEYVWIIDPIDGTKAYFHGSNLFAIALSLYKNSKPIFGIIYLPTLREIIYNDENGDVYNIKNAFTSKEVKVPVFFQKQELNESSLVYFPVKHAKECIKNYKFTFIDGYSAYIYAFDVLNNIAQGCFLKKNISMWDIYSTLPIANSLGINIYNIENSNKLTKLNFDLFKDDFKAKNIWLLCHPCYKDELMSILYLEK